jgi:hypothetical protein
MTQTEALKLALDALEKSDSFLYNWHENSSDDEADAYSTARQLNEKAIAAIKEVLAHPAVQQGHEQEPVGKIVDCDFVGNSIARFERHLPFGTLLYTFPPPQRTWVGLTDEQIFSIAYDCNALPETITDETLIIFARALWVVFGIKEKNT